MVESKEVLSLFHPLLGHWFAQKVGRPTEVQAQAWPRIVQGEHVLVTAPTGSGKTLTAFLWGLNQLISGEWPLGRTSVLYVSPLKALNNDIQRNLLLPLAQLREEFEKAGLAFPIINVQTRSGDTPEADRRRMVRHPPEILITTPESLNILLSSTGGRSILTTLRVVILDEIHAVIGSKRGVHLITAVDRLVMLSGEFQRLALSATIKPLETVAAFVGGYKLEGAVNNPRYLPRPVSIVESRMSKQYDVRVHFPQAETEQPQESVWGPLAAEFKKIISRNQSTLLFANSRRLAEKLTLQINQDQDRPVAYAHHGSLSREIRGEVERKLKAGDLKAIVATNSLELGIDIGALDEVILVQSPPSVSAAVQRVGRAGHNVGQVSRGAIFPTHDQDLLEATVLCPAIVRQNIEQIKPVSGALDVLAQVILSMAGTTPWDMDELFARLKAGYPYRHLSREQFDLVLNMLAGRYSDARIRELKPRLYIDRIDNTVAARPGTQRLLYTSGGTIPDRGYFQMRHQETNLRLGELDEEFVWEARIGQTFTLGTQNWRIERITHSDVFVLPARPTAGTPFWHGEEIGRDFHFSEMISSFLEQADQRLESPDFIEALKKEHFLDQAAAEHLVSFLKEQKEATARPLPHRRHLLVEHVSTGPGGAPGNQVVLHNFWGLELNRPYALALEAAWEERYRGRVEIYAANDSVTLVVPDEVRTEELLSLVIAANLETLLRQRLEGSGYFAARFRECAGRALLLIRHKFSERRPLWMTRLKSRQLLDSVRRYHDFPILLEAWRTCLQDEFDLPNLKQVLSELESGAMAWSEARTSLPSPMTRSLTWRHINEYMYMTDEPAADTVSRLSRDLLREVVFSPGLRPAVSSELVNRFELKRRRLAEGYSPSSPQDLLDWVKERLLIPASEWKRLLEAVQRDHRLETEPALQLIGPKLAWITPPRAGEPLLASLELLPRIMAGFYNAKEGVATTGLNHEPIQIPPALKAETDELLSSVLGEWLQFYGPITGDFILKTLGLDEDRLLQALEDLAESGTIIGGRLTQDGAGEKICDAENYEMLLRLARAEAIPVFEPLPLESLPLFLADFHGLTAPGRSADDLRRGLEQLLCLSLPAELWEAEIFPARLQAYDPAWLDALMQEGPLRWIGDPQRRIAFCFANELDLLLADSEAEGSLHSDASYDDLLPDPEARYDLAGLVRATGKSPSELVRGLWEAVWQGRMTSDNFTALRRGIENQFKPPEEAMIAITAGRGRRPGRRSGFARWKSALPLAGNWFRLDRPDQTQDLLETEEIKKDRVRFLLDRYGVLFRDLLEKEAPAWRWPSLFRSLRLMELSGEVLAGIFFQKIPGPQFISHSAFRRLQRTWPDDSVFWLNAADPASLCGLGPEQLKSSLPRRSRSTHLVYRGTSLVMVSERKGKSLTFNVPPDDPDLVNYLAPLRHLLSRKFQPLRRIKIETINGIEAGRSPYVDALRTCFDLTIEYKNVILYRRPE